MLLKIHSKSQVMLVVTGPAPSLVNALSLLPRIFVPSILNFLNKTLTFRLGINTAYWSQGRKAVRARPWGQVTCPGFHSWEVSEVRFEPWTPVSRLVRNPLSYPASPRSLSLESKIVLLPLYH